LAPAGRCRSSGDGLGRAPDTFRDTISAARLRPCGASTDASPRCAAINRAPSPCTARAQTSRDRARLQAIGLAHYELGQCYRQVGDTAIVREHITKAASALVAAGDRRHLALVQSLSSISLAQLGRYDEAMTALGQAERLATAIEADDVLATVCGNQANVLMMEHRYEPALALAERSVSLHEQHGSGHGLSVALATLGQICVRLGDLARAETALHRALDVRARSSSTRRRVPCSTRSRRFT
jgi:tetratricopeptide (TPR) repeat protein